MRHNFATFRPRAAITTSDDKMTYATITGWGKCLPPASLTNDDLGTIMDTSDEWIYPRTGIKARRVSHVSTQALAQASAGRACWQPCTAWAMSSRALCSQGGSTSSQLAIGVTRSPHLMRAAPQVSPAPKAAVSR